MRRSSAPPSVEHDWEKWKPVFQKDHVHSNAQALGGLLVRQQRGKLAERLIRRIGALARLRIDDLVDGAGEVERRLFAVLLAPVEQHAYRIVLARGVRSVSAKY